MPTLQVGRLGRALAKSTDERLRQVGLTTAQLPVFAALAGGNGKTQKELAALAGVEQPSMAQLLVRMERDGLILRLLSPHDRRSSVIMLTEAASALLKPGRDVLRQIDEDACVCLSREEQATLTRLLTRMIEHQAPETHS